MEFKEIYGYFVSESGIVKNKHGKILKPHDNGRGYLILNLRQGGKSRTKAIHRLVAEAWVDNPEDLPEVDHINGIKLDNHKSNLRWVTRGENIQHAFTLNKRSATGINNANCKHTEQEIREICEYLEAGLRSCDVRDLGYNYTTVRNIKRRVQWEEISKNYTW